MRLPLVAALRLAPLIVCTSAWASETFYEADVCIYGGTASGICAGLAASRRGQ